MVDCIGRFNKGEIDADTSCQIEKQILTDEIQDPELLNLAVENLSELFGYLATGRVNAPYEKPENPEIVLNTEQMDVQMCIDKVISHLKLNNLSI